jgi:hypothetical protein
MSSDDIKITFNNNQENNKKVSVKFETINDIPQETKSSLINQNNKIIIDDILTEMKILGNNIEKKSYNNHNFQFQNQNFNSNLDNNYLFNNNKYNSSSSQIININKDLDSLKKRINSNVLSKYFLNKENNFGCSFNKNNLYKKENEKYNNNYNNNNLFFTNYDNIGINEKNFYNNSNFNQVNNIISLPSNYIQSKLKKINSKILYNKSGFSQTDIFPNNYI